ncbi:MAG: L-2-hydroxyglutarate oxidase [Bacteroidota bacterium]
MTPRVDIVIVGGGIVGLATAYQIGQRFPKVSVAVLEKEASVGQHQTGHNSGVLHSGIYYKPGSLKAINCRAGKKAMEAFCEDEGIDYDLCGKVIVATRPEEIPHLQRIFDRGQANGVTCEMIGPERLAEVEPHTAGIQAIHVPESGIVNYGQVCERLQAKIKAHGHHVELNAAVIGVQQRSGSVVVQTRRGNIEAKQVVACAGLYSDRVATMSGAEPDVQIVPFRGEYFELTPDAEHLCNGLIYPVPDPNFPFLGVHFTRMITGGVECGPNAVLAFAREGYTKLKLNPKELIEALRYKGFQRIAAKYWQTGLGEMWRSASKGAFVRALQRLVPEIRKADLVAAPAGVRAQALRPDGSMVDDFAILRHDRVVNVINAPSPAATASLNIGKLIVKELGLRRL